MSVYVDSQQNAYGNMIMCHMIADSTDELLTMAARIGVSSKWIQCAGTKKEHFDICRAKRKLAIYYGAVEISGRELVQKMQR